jgi:hypothetical protein
MSKLVKVKKEKIIAEQQFIKNNKSFSEYWSGTNTLLLIVGFLLLFLGFYLMSAGNWNDPITLSISPIILLFAYIIIFPIAILFKAKK